MEDVDSKNTDSTGDLVEATESPVSANEQVIDKVFEVARRIASEVIDQYAQQIEDQEEDIIIYQYTNGAGLEGMIRSGKIWATATEYLNDSQELRNGLEYTLKICEDIRCKKSISERFRAFIDRLSRRSEVRGAYFVACFTQNGDQLSQWRGYGDGGNGYSVGFSLKDLNNNMHSAVSKIPSLAFRGFNQVIYDEITKTVAIEDYIEKYYEAVIEELGDDDFDEHMSLVVGFCFMAIHDIFSLIKHEAFAEEEEVRASFYEYIDGSSNVRRRGNLFVPYYEVGQEDGRLPIREIIVGPTTDYALTKRGLEALLSRYGFDNGEVDIRPSSAPYKT